MEISFRKLEDKEEDYLKLYNWCKQKFIYEWFEQRVLTYNEIVNKYKNKLNKKEQDLFIIKYNDLDIGFIQVYKYNDNLPVEVTNAYEYDMFIGEEEYLNKGIGKEIMNAINNIIYETYKANTIILRPFKRNIRSVKCCLKSGFKEVYEYLGKDTLGNPEMITVLLNDRK